MAEVTVTIARRRLKLSNLDKVLYPSVAFTKAQVLDYYRRVAKAMLPHLSHRPVTLKRYPNGVDAPSFYEKRCPSHKPSWMQTAEVGHGGERPVNYCLINDIASLVWVANLAAIELHTLLCRFEAPNEPTMIAFDLDPGEGLTILDCAAVAVELRDMLEGLGLKSFPKTSSGKGLHFYVPLNSPATFEQTKAFSRTVAETFEAHNKDRVVSKMSKALRKGKVFVDWSQNDQHKTTVCAYSLRARAEPIVSTPLTWDEIEAAIMAAKPDRLKFLAEDVLKRVEKHGDLFAEVLSLKQSLPGTNQAKAKARRVSRQSDPLKTYRDKRDFRKTTEPAGEPGAPKQSRRIFVIQQHAARAMHYDLRLEIDGVLASWAVPKGPSLNPREKRLAVQVEDHPLDYADFEGVIPEGEYGAGPVIVWDAGTYRNLLTDDDGAELPMPAAIEKGHVEVQFIGEKLHGAWHLVRTRPNASGKPQWLLMKKKDAAADTDVDVVAADPRSVLTGRTIDEVREQEK